MSIFGIVLIVIVVEVVDELVVVLLLLLLLVVIVVGVDVVVVIVTLLALVEVEAVVDGISGIKCNSGGAGLGRRPTHLSHIAPPVDDSPSPRKTSVDNRSLSNVSAM